MGNHDRDRGTKTGRGTIILDMGQGTNLDWRPARRGLSGREPLDYRDREPLIIGTGNQDLWECLARAPPLACGRAWPERLHCGRLCQNLPERDGNHWILGLEPSLEFRDGNLQDVGRSSSPVQPRTLAVTQPLPLSPFSSVSYDRLRCSRQRRSAWSSALARVGGVLGPRLLGTMPMLPRQSHSEPTLCGELRRLDITAVPGLGNRVSALDWRRSDRRRARDC